jgi:type I restriction enzyme S subunit
VNRSLWDQVPLMELCNPKQWPTISGQELTSSGFPVYGANGKIGFFSEYNHEEATILVACRGATCGAINVCEPRSYVTGNAMALDDLDLARVDFRFMVHALIVRGFDDAVTGTAQPQITRESLRRVKVWLPPLAEQRRIADILDKADAIRRKRKESIALSEELLRSAFLETFGDPVKNRQGWPVKPLGELLAAPLRNGLSPATGGKFEAQVLTLSAITRGRFDASASKPGAFAVEPWEDVRVDARDFLICRGNGNVALVGTAAFPRDSMKNMVFPDTMIAARIDQSCLRPAFLNAIWKSRFVRRQIEAGARTTNGTFKINQTVVESIELVVPPLARQQVFADLEARVVKNASHQHAAIERAEELFNTLVARAFSGMMEAPC